MIASLRVLLAELHVLLSKTGSKIPRPVVILKPYLLLLQ